MCLCPFPVAEHCGHTQPAWKDRNDPCCMMGRRFCWISDPLPMQPIISAGGSCSQHITVTHRERAWRQHKHTARSIHSSDPTHFSLTLNTAPCLNKRCWFVSHTHGFGPFPSLRIQVCSIAFTHLWNVVNGEVTLWYETVKGTKMTAWDRDHTVGTPLHKQQITVTNNVILHERNSLTKI